jgi:copper chaperone CopZ
MKAMAPYLLAMGLSAVGLCAQPEIAHATTVTETWDVEGMHSGADVKQVRNALRTIPGISVQEVTQADVEIRFDNQKLTDSQLRTRMAQALAQVSTPQHPFRLMQKAD